MSTFFRINSDNFSWFFLPKFPSSVQVLHTKSILDLEEEKNGVILIYINDDK